MSSFPRPVNTAVMDDVEVKLQRLRELSGDVFGDRSIENLRWIEMSAVAKWQRSMQQLLDSWATVEEVLFWEALEQWRLVVLNRRSPSNSPNPVGGRPDRPGVSLVLLECEGIPEVYSWMKKLSGEERFMEGTQIDWNVIIDREGDFFTWKDIDLAANKRAMRELMDGVIKSDWTFVFAPPHRSTQTVDPWCKGYV
jgi:hypothetical protein